MMKRLRSLSVLLLVGSLVLLPAQKASATGCDGQLLECLNGGETQGFCCMGYCIGEGGNWVICWLMCGGMD